MTTPVNSVKIPAEFVKLCEAWHGGMRSMFYAVASTRGLTCGSIRPARCETDEQWYYGLWRDLAYEAFTTRRDSEKNPDATDYIDLCRFERFCDEIAERLEREYGLQDWEGC